MGHDRTIPGNSTATQWNLKSCYMQSAVWVKKVQNVAFPKSLKCVFKFGPRHSFSSAAAQSFRMVQLSILGARRACRLARWYLWPCIDPYWSLSSNPAEEYLSSAFVVSRCQRRDWSVNQQWSVDLWDSWVELWRLNWPGCFFVSSA